MSSGEGDIMPVITAPTSSDSMTETASASTTPPTKSAETASASTTPPTKPTETASALTAPPTKSAETASAASDISEPIDDCSSGTDDNTETQGASLVDDISSVASGWLSGWAKTLNTAREKSVEVLDMVRKDVGELTSTVQAETSSLISSTSQTIRHQLSLDDTSSTAAHITRSLTDFLHHVQYVFTPDTVDDSCVQAYLVQNGQAVEIDRLQAEIVELCSTAATFTTDPAPAGDYAVWRDQFSVEQRQPELSDQLANSSQLLGWYSQLVPHTVSHADFWHRYLFRVWLAEKRQKKQLERQVLAEQMRAKAAETTDRINWDQEDLSGHVQVSERQTERLLSDFERESGSATTAPLSEAAAAAGGAGAAAGGGSRQAPKAKDEGSPVEEDWVKTDELETVETASSNVDSLDWDKCTD